MRILVSGYSFMSRVANSPVELPEGVEIALEGQRITVKGKKGSLSLDIHQSVDVKQEDKILVFVGRDGSKVSRSMAGTFRSLINNMVFGVTVGYEKKLVLNGVGYRAKASGRVINLTLGFSHPIDHKLPDGVEAETPTQTEIVLRSMDKQLLGQTASEVRAYRPPEPYKGKGVSYADERVRRKEAKKK